MEVSTILSQYALGAVHSVVPVGTGLTNTTYRVVCDAGDFILQKIHPAIPDAAAEDMRVVTDYLFTCGMQVPRLIMTTDGAPFVRHADGLRFRLYPWIAGSVVDAVQDAAMAREAGRIVGEMHGHLAQLAYTPQGSIPHFHDTAFIVNELKTVASDLPVDMKVIADDILSTLPGCILGDEAGQKTVIHADLKISNLLFSADGKAIGVIDFDTILLHYVAIDLGDAFRSWCNPTAEDNPEAVFSMELFTAAVDGYGVGRGQGVTPEERAQYLQATKQIALELASRFLIDVVRDTYFGYDAKRYTDRRSHNIARAQGQYHFAQSIPV